MPTAGHYVLPIKVGCDGTQAMASVQPSLSKVRLQLRCSGAGRVAPHRGARLGGGHRKSRKVASVATQASPTPSSHRKCGLGSGTNLFALPLGNLSHDPDHEAVSEGHLGKDGFLPPTSGGETGTWAGRVTPTIVNGVTIAPAGQRRVFTVGYDCGLIADTGGTGQPAAAYSCNLSGNRIPHSPELSGAISGQYDIELPGGGRLSPYAQLNFSSHFFGSPSTRSSIARMPSPSSICD